MGGTKGKASKDSTSKRPQEEEHKEKDLTPTYKAKFPILSHEEGA